MEFLLVEIANTKWNTRVQKTLKMKEPSNMRLGNISPAGVDICQYCPFHCVMTIELKNLVKSNHVLLVVPAKSFTKKKQE